MTHDDKPTTPNMPSDTVCAGRPLRFAASDVADVAAVGATTAGAFIDQCTATVSLSRSSANPTFGFAKY